MTNGVRALQSHIAALHHEMGILWQWVEDRDTRITALQEQIETLTEQYHALCTQRNELRQKRITLTEHAQLVKADRDTLATILIPLLDNGEVEAELNAARLVAVLLLSTEDRTHAWQLIQRAMQYANQVDTLACHLRTLLEQECTDQPADHPSSKADEFTALAHQISTPHVRTKLQHVLDSVLKDEQSEHNRIPNWQKHTKLYSYHHNGHDNGNGHSNGNGHGMHVILESR